MRGLEMPPMLLNKDLRQQMVDLRDYLVRLVRALEAGEDEQTLAAAFAAEAEKKQLASKDWVRSYVASQQGGQH